MKVVTPSLARRIATSGATILVGVLVVVGIGTGVVLHTREVASLDRALLAAALGRAHPEVAAKVEVEHVRSPIAVWLVLSNDARVPAAAVRIPSRSSSVLAVLLT